MPWLCTGTGQDAMCQWMDHLPTNATKGKGKGKGKGSSYPQAPSDKVQKYLDQANARLVKSEEKVQDLLNKLKKAPTTTPPSAPGQPHTHPDGDIICPACGARHLNDTKYKCRACKAPLKPAPNPLDQGKGKGKGKGEREISNPLLK